MTPGTGDRTATLVLAAVALLAGIAAVVWAGAAIACLGVGASASSFTDSLRAASRLPGHLSEPGKAWPAPLDIDPVRYWLGQTIVLAFLAVAARLAWPHRHHLWGSRQALGVKPHVGVATRLPALTVSRV
jgi:hypothetical protein